ncbi:hypothetical protein CU305_08655 [Prochlorococcus marinus str. MU1416]|nr:hypothetical protein [Prochlorococcus marinus str. MU1416]
MIREIRRVIIFSTINLLSIKKYGFIPLSLYRQLITVYFRFSASLTKQLFYLARTREGTYKNIFKNILVKKGSEIDPSW